MKFRKIHYYILRNCIQSNSLSILCKFFYIKPNEKLNNNITENSIYFRLYRAVNFLVSNGFLSEIKLSNICFYTTTLKGVDILSPSPPLQTLDLFDVVHNSNQKKTEYYLTDDEVKKCKSAKGIGLLQDGREYKIPLRISQERKEVIDMLYKCGVVSSDTRDVIDSKFKDYLSIVLEKELVYIKKNDVISGQAAPKVLKLPCKTRFTDNFRKFRALNNYDIAIDNATKHFKTAVHLVLTTDPKLFSSVYDSYKHFGKALNRFFSRIKKKTGERPIYITAYEFFKKTGFMHCHIIIFGKLYFMAKRNITKLWEQCGQGSYNWIYGLRNICGRWEYATKKPKFINKNQTATDYLKKYLKKSLLYGVCASLYWASNKRFYTNSRCLIPQGVKHKKLPIYRLLGIFYKGRIPDAIHLIEYPDYCKFIDDSYKPPPKFQTISNIN